MILDTLSFFKLLDKCKVNNSTFTIELPNGSIFLFKGLDDGEKIKSIAGITDIVIEEATELVLDEFTQLDLRVRDKKAPNQQIYLMFNPVSKANWCYKHWFNNPYLEDAFILKTTYKDNRFLPLKTIKSMEQLKHTNPNYYEIYALGEFCSLDKLIFYNWETRDFNYKDIDGVPIAGLDFGYVNDSTAFIASKIVEDAKEIYIYKEHYAKGMLNNGIADMLKYQSYSKDIIIADSAEAKSIDELKRLGITRIKPASKGAGSVLQGIQHLQQYRLIVNSNCLSTITELQNYAWKKDKQTNEYINEPIDDYNHCLDALRYSLQCVENNKRIQTLSKAVLGI